MLDHCSEQEVNGGKDWYFHLYITNKSSWDLELDSASQNLIWGIWYRNNQDGLEPLKTIKRGESREVVGIRASSGTWTGYQFSCAWNAMTDGTPVGALRVDVDVPFWSSVNTGTLVTTNVIKDSGWVALAKSKTKFIENVEITDRYPDDTEETEDKDTDPETIARKQYKRLMINYNEMIRNWDDLEKNLVEQASVDPHVCIPQKYTYPPTVNLLARTAPHDIQQNNWSGINDLIYDTDWAKREYVKSYFSVAIYSINTNPRSTLSIPAGQETVEESSVEVTSAIAQTLTDGFSIRTLIGAEYSGVKSELEATYNRESVVEESSSRVERATKTITIAASENNRLFVPWVFSTAIAIYRTTKKGKTELIAVSEWADEVIDTVYDY